MEQKIQHYSSQKSGMSSQKNVCSLVCLRSSLSRLKQLKKGAVRSYRCSTMGIVDIEFRWLGSPVLLLQIKAIRYSNSIGHSSNSRLLVGQHRPYIDSNPESVLSFPAFIWNNIPFFYHQRIKEKTKVNIKSMSTKKEEIV